MTNVIQMGDYRAPVKLPVELSNARSWLVWRLVQMPGDKKAKKIPYYTSGDPREGPQGEHEPLVTFDRAVAAVVKGKYTGVGLAMLASNGLVALDFDDCVDEAGAIDPRVEELLQGTYSEFSPSGTGVRAFFRGAVRDRKDHNKTGRRPFAIEFFHAAGYVTVTGNVTPICEMWGWDGTVAPMSAEVLALYRERFGDESRLDDDWLLAAAPKIGLTLEKARAFIEALDADCGYEEWLHAGQSLHHEFDGSEEALRVWQEWSKKSDDKYPGDRALRQKWESFGRYQGAPITAAWLLKHSKVARVAARYEAVSEWKTRVAQVEDDYDLREKVCPGIAADKRLDHIDRESLAQALMARFKRLGTVLPIAAVRKLVAPPDTLVPTVRLRRPLTEFGNAERMLDKFGESLMFVPELKTWHVWTGVYWRRATDVEIEHYAKETVRGLVSEADEHQDAGEFFGFCAISQQARMVGNMVRLAASDPRVMVPAEELDKHQYLLGVQNGVVDLRTGKLMQPDPAYRITRVCRCEYRPEAKAPLFRQTVLDVFNDDAEMAEFFQRLIGYTSLGVPTEDVMIIAHGNGSNGKSTLFGTIRRVFGGYARAADATTFLSEGLKGGAGGAREDLVRLKGTRFCYVNEPDEGGELKEGMVKSMTGGDAISARGLYAKETVEIEPSWVVVMPTNHKPIVKGSDNGIWRRLMLIPFTRNFENDNRVQKDPDREQKLQAEAEGVLAWIVEGARAYLQVGLCPPPGVARARDQYRSQMDLLAEWIEDCCEVDAAYSESSQRLWQSWEEHARQRGVLQYIRSSVALGRRLDQRFPTIKGNAGIRLRSGIRLRQSKLDSDDFFGN